MFSACGRPRDLLRRSLAGPDQVRLTSILRDVAVELVVGHERAGRAGHEESRTTTRNHGEHAVANGRAVPRGAARRRVDGGWQAVGTNILTSSGPCAFRAGSSAVPVVPARAREHGPAAHMTRQVQGCPARVACLDRTSQPTSEPTGQIGEPGNRDASRDVTVVTRLRAMRPGERLVVERGRGGGRARPRLPTASGTSSPASSGGQRVVRGRDQRAIPGGQPQRCAAARVSARARRRCAAVGRARAAGSRDGADRGHEPVAVRVHLAVVVEGHARGRRPARHGQAHRAEPEPDHHLAQTLRGHRRTRRRTSVTPRRRGRQRPVRVRRQHSQRPAHPAACHQTAACQCTGSAIATRAPTLRASRSSRQQVGRLGDPVGEGRDRELGPLAGGVVVEGQQRPGRVGRAGAASSRSAGVRGPVIAGQGVTALLCQPGRGGHGSANLVAAMLTARRGQRRTIQVDRLAAGSVSPTITVGRISHACHSSPVPLAPPRGPACARHPPSCCSASWPSRR